LPDYHVTASTTASPRATRQSGERTEMADIFLSYSSTDRDRAKLLAEAIGKHGWSVWWDQKIPLGKSWDEVVEEQVDAARCIIVLWSKESITSSWVRTEAREGKARGILIPVLIDDVKIPLEFRHMQAANLAGWQPSEPSAEFDSLLAFVAELLAGPHRADEPRSHAEVPQAAPERKGPYLTDPSRPVHQAPEGSRKPAKALALPTAGEIRLAATLGGPASGLCLCFLPDGDRLATLWADGLIRIWQTENGRLLQTLRGEGHDAWRVSTAACFSADGTLLATTPDTTTVLVWRVSDGKLLHSLKGHIGQISAVMFSADSRLLASASSDKTARIWSMRDGALVRTMEGNTQWMSCIAVSPDGEMIATGAEVIINAPELKLWSVADGKMLFRLAGHASTINDIAFSPDGTLLATGAGDGSPRTWQVSDGAPVRTFQPAENVGRLSFSPDGRLLATADLGKGVSMWSTEDGALLQKLDGHGATVKSLTFSLDGRMLASSSADNTVRLWSLYD
jgi:glucose/arabinose dehydrogenase